MIKDIIAIAHRAGDRIMEIYNSGEFEVEEKDDEQHSPLTKADLIANTTIIEGLKEISSLPIVTEESTVDYDERRNWSSFWLVDPLDGTKDFIAKNGEFTVNIALIEDHASVLGVVLAPALDLTYSARKGRGAYKDDEPICNKSTRTELIGSDSRFHSTEATLTFLEKHNIKTVKRFGSALKLCMLAEGVIDVYPRLNGTMEWDTAAAHIIANEGGCKLIDVETTEELRYNKESMLNHHFIACRNDLDFF